MKDQDTKALTASGRPFILTPTRATPSARVSIDTYRREKADRAIAYIEKCYREKRAIPDLG